MRMNRRNVLVGLGTIVAGGGAALGTGAFSSVEADRSITIDVDGDGAAFVTISPADSSLVDTSGDEEVVISWDSADYGNESEGGMHQNATITIAEALEFEHNGESGTNYEISLQKEINESSGEVSFTQDTVTVNHSDTEPQTVGLEITTPEDGSSIDGTFTITIEEAS